MFHVHSFWVKIIGYNLRGVDRLNDQIIKVNEDEIIRLVQEAMNSNISKEEFALFLKSKAQEKVS